jgi:hypothetical protein
MQKKLGEVRDCADEHSTNRQFWSKTTGKVIEGKYA